MTLRELTILKETRGKKDKQEELLLDLKEYYDIGAKSFVLNRDHVELVIELLLKRRKIDEAMQVARKYFKKGEYLHGSE